MVLLISISERVALWLNAWVSLIFNAWFMPVQERSEKLWSSVGRPTATFLLNSSLFAFNPVALTDLRRGTAQTTMHRAPNY
jgi:hypothetical protein